MRYVVFRTTEILFNTIFDATILSFRDSKETPLT
jgi:hypothetical protein